MIPRSSNMGIENSSFCFLPCKIMDLIPRSSDMGIKNFRSSSVGLGNTMSHFPWVVGTTMSTIGEEQGFQIYPPHEQSSHEREPPKNDYSYYYSDYYKIICL